MNNIQRLTEELVTSSVDEAFEQFKRCGRLYKRGCLDYNSYYTKMFNIILEYYFRFLSDIGLKNVSCPKSWERLLEDYALWSEGKEPDSTIGQPWLIDKRSTDEARKSKEVSKTTNVEIEASIKDKSQFFKLMEKYHIPIDFYTPIPEDIIAPYLNWMHTYSDNSLYQIIFYCIDDGGLLEEENPVGKTYTLINKLGLKAVLTITEVRKIQKEDSRSLYGKYLSTGYVEGYTAIEREYPEVGIEIDKDGSILAFHTYLDRKDMSVFNNYPLWQNYLAWTSAWQYYFEKFRNEFFDTFIPEE